MPETQFFEHDLTLSAQSVPAGKTFPARLAYWTFGDPSSPAVLLPSCYGGTLANTLPFLYDEKAHPSPILPPTKYFIIVTGLLSGSESSSPHNTPAPFDGPNFPHTTYEDNIRLQHALCQKLGVKKLFLYAGFSMGGQQAYHISALYPSFVEHMICLAGSARTSWHNWCFLEGPRHAITCSKDYHDGNYDPKVGAPAGTRAFSRVYSAWALSQGWFREKCWEQLGHKDLESYLEANWSGFGDANDLLRLLWTWQQGDITLYYPVDHGDLAKTLGRIEAKCLIFPSRTDCYFPPEDNEEEVKHLKHGEFRVIETVWGHLAGGGSGTKEDTEYIIQEVKRFLKL
ncbi:hypothetical protein LTR35_010952 [Friedmanniomyces endolithicus]|uniref:AB hydrolase-1 domain-containing protein n=1 Tax=Friedmanniomyces endolithicus TaxID=329885 RepID=A0AAN6J546_9PEZI|nr:hypothetical protein LTR35_010952 [Friedmanniomyces endolithicus]KAK0278379.1 hypothetical protein LTS00_013829 [Friedmanniomyces endolithicus]KAK0316200.1 hypothetical protein LTR82_012228 [Friedmanniomyces endolithicus]KAK0992531.1 hypothetical protein LTR54_011402 [Friedmanniomyces endolithicus]